MLRFLVERPKNPPCYWNRNRYDDDSYKERANVCHEIGVNRAKGIKNYIHYY